MTPSISIIVTARNNGKYLKECLESCLNQTVPCEVVYSDDFSTDDSVKIAKSLKTVKVITHKEHVGVVQARNDGADSSSGDALVFVDGDDILPPNYIEKHLEVFDENTPFVYAAVKAFGNFETFWDVKSWGVLNLWNRNFVNTSGMMWRHTFEKAGKWQETSVKTMWDFHLGLRMQRLGTPRKSDAVLHYRQHNDSWSFGKEKIDNCVIRLSESIRREVVQVSIGLVYGGRIPRFFNIWMKSLIEDIKILNHKPELIIYNNSSENLKKQMEKYNKYFSRVKIINHPEKITFISETDRRNKVCELLANAYSMILENCTGDLIHLREDDVIPPPGGFEKLFNFITAGNPIKDAVAGAYFNRNKHWQRWIGGIFKDPVRTTQDFDVLPSDKPFKVDFTGTGCILFWKHMCPTIYKPYIDGIQAHDWAWCLDLKKMGRELWMHPEVVCRHYEDATNYLQPTDKITPEMVTPTNIYSAIHGKPIKKIIVKKK